jgi:hypothetical protein
VVIKAYHQVGADDTTPAQRKAYLDEILELGEIVPAIKRVQRLEMEKECFVDQAQSGHDFRFLSRQIGQEAEEALILMAREKLSLLPADGSTHTMFNCLDLLAGDFERVFLSVGDWYSAPNGLVFDAEELLLSGGRYRELDVLGDYAYEIEKVAEFAYDSVEDARREINAAIKRARRKRESTGKQAVTLLRADCSSPEGCPGEIVWPGPLPVSLAMEIWRDGRRVRRRS